MVAAAEEKQKTDRAVLPSFHQTPVEFRRELKRSRLIDKVLAREAADAAKEVFTLIGETIDDGRIDERLEAQERQEFFRRLVS